MIDRRYMASEYLNDPTQRTRLLDYMASIYECLADFSAELLALQHGVSDQDEYEARCYRACTLAMDIQGDWKMIAPILLDIYRDTEPVS